MLARTEPTRLSIIGLSAGVICYQASFQLRVNRDPALEDEHIHVVRGVQFDTSKIVVVAANAFQLHRLHCKNNTTTSHT